MYTYTRTLIEAHAALELADIHGLKSHKAPDYVKQNQTEWDA
jgi:hypothetical protein